MFTERLEAVQRATGGRLCVGLDPHPGMIPAEFGPGAAGVEAFLADVIEKTKAYACAYKPNSAFFEALGAEGISVLRSTVDRIRAAERLAVLDAKRGDIASTAAAYARAARDVLAADAITVVAYMGDDAVIPFLESGLGVFIVALPSNPAAAWIIDHGSPPLFLRMAELAVRLETAFPGQVGLVVGATHPGKVRDLHRAAPDLPWLVPGVGAQGGDVAAFLAAAGDHRHLLFNVSRGVLAAADPEDAARRYRTEMGGTPCMTKRAG